jgi:hypothetical protein
LADNITSNNIKNKCHKRNLNKIKHSSRRPGIKPAQKFGPKAQRATGRRIGKKATVTEIKDKKKGS